MDGAKSTSSISDPGLAALVMLLRFQGVGIDLEQIRHQFLGRLIGVPEMLRCAKGFGLKARSVSTKWERLAGIPLPGIAALYDGSFLLLGKAGDDHICVGRDEASRHERARVCASREQDGQHAYARRSDTPRNEPDRPSISSR